VVPGTVRSILPLTETERITKDINEVL